MKYLDNEIPPGKLMSCSWWFDEVQHHPKERRENEVFYRAKPSGVEPTVHSEP